MVKHESVVGSTFWSPVFLMSCSLTFDRFPNPLIPSFCSALPFCSGDLSLASHLYVFFGPKQNAISLSSIKAQKSA